MDEQNPRVTEDDVRGRSDEQVSGRVRTSATGRPRSTRPTSTGTARTSSPTAAAGVRPSAEDDVEAGAGVRAREIEAEIEQTRADMSETVNAIQERLRPSNVVANATDRVKTAARERVRDIADSEPVLRVRSNPMPMAMVGIGLIGLGWLALSDRNASGYSPYRTRSHGRQRDWRSMTETGSAVPYRSGAYTGQEDASGYTSELDYSARPAGGTDYATRSGTGAEYGARGPSSRSAHTEAGHGGGQGVGTRMREARQAFPPQALRRSWNENPLLIGAAACVAGAIVGLAVPETERENELMGSARDGMIETVQETVREKVDQVQQAATDAAGTVQEAAKSAVGLTGTDAQGVRTDRPESAG
jgi:hypothetical protein